MSATFRTKDPNLAALLLYELGADVLLGIEIDEQGYSLLQFDKAEQCRSIKRAFYADDSSDGFFPQYPVNDARALLKAAAAVHKQLSKGRQQWQRAKEISQ